MNLQPMCFSLLVRVGVTNISTIRGRYNFTDRIYFTARGDVGGFGAGADFTWQATAALGMQLNDRMFAEAGYRILGVDYRNDGLIYDVRTHGAEINLGITF